MLSEDRNKLLRELKADKKSEDYRNGYVDGVLDMFNAAKKGEKDGKAATTT